MNSKSWFVFITDSVDLLVFFLRKFFGIPDHNSSVCNITESVILVKEDLILYFVRVYEPDFFPLFCNVKGYNFTLSPSVRMHQRPKAAKLMLLFNNTRLTITSCDEVFSIGTKVHG